jgi:hypothetical protein
MTSDATQRGANVHSVRAIPTATSGTHAPVSPAFRRSTGKATPSMASWPMRAHHGTDLSWVDRKRRMTRRTNQISAAAQAAIQAIVRTVQTTAPLLSANTA